MLCKNVLVCKILQLDYLSFSCILHHVVYRYKTLPSALFPREGSNIDTWFHHKEKTWFKKHILMSQSIFGPLHSHFASLMMWIGQDNGENITQTTQETFCILKNIGKTERTPASSTYPEVLTYTTASDWKTPSCHWRYFYYLYLLY